MSVCVKELVSFYFFHHVQFDCMHHRYSKDFFTIATEIENEQKKIIKLLKQSKASSTDDIRHSTNTLKSSSCNIFLKKTFHRLFRPYPEWKFKLNSQFPFYRSTIWRKKTKTMDRVFFSCQFCFIIYFCSLFNYSLREWRKTNFVLSFCLLHNKNCEKKIIYKIS